MSREILIGGRADGVPDSMFPEKQLEKGIAVEQEEHTNNPAIAKEITKDHLSENDEYYDFLEKMENHMEKESGFINIKTIDALLSKGNVIKKGSFEKAFNTEIRKVLSFLINSEYNLDEPTVLKLAEEEIGETLHSTVPMFRYNEYMNSIRIALKNEYNILQTGRTTT
jgi:hypothetical protein